MCKDGGRVRMADHWQKNTWTHFLSSVPLSCTHICVGLYVERVSSFSCCTVRLGSPSSHSHSDIILVQSQTRWPYLIGLLFWRKSEGWENNVKNYTGSPDGRKQFINANKNVLTHSVLELESNTFCWTQCSRFLPCIGKRDTTFRLPLFAVRVKIMLPLARFAF